MRVFLDHGFEIPHLVLNDGSLTEDDFRRLERLPLVIVEKEKVKLHDVPKAVYLAKTEGFVVGFEKYNAVRVIVMDCDIFFFRNWDADLRKICMNTGGIALRDWGSSLGPDAEGIRKELGFYEDATTPNCNTGMSSMTSDKLQRLKTSIRKYIDAKKMWMEDQFAIFATFYGELEYINGIKCCINGGEFIKEIMDWWLSQNACHLMGMRERPYALDVFMKQSLSNMPESIHLSNFPTAYKKISFGLMEYGTYAFNYEFQYIPSSYQGKYVTDALYLHGGSHVVWKLPPQCLRFKTKIVCMDSGIKANCGDVIVSGNKYRIEDEIDIPLEGKLEIQISEGGGAHFAFLKPEILIKRLSD